jgi:hypothetical protein
MTDTSAPSAPDQTVQTVQTVQTEVPVDVNQTSGPTPIGAQVPERPVNKTPSRREAIQAAFDRANSPPPKKATEAKTAPKAAEAKAGHNKPPEPVENEGIDLKKRPGEQPRDRGRFAPRTQPGALENQNEPAVQSGKGTIGTGTDPAQSYPSLPVNAPYAAPPPRMAEHGKRDWSTTPESVRGEVYRMHDEFGKAYQAYRGAHEAFQPIARFHQLAQQHGTTLEKALTNYVGIEQKLRSDPIAALDTIVNNLGLTDPQTGQRIGLRDVAYTVLSQSPEQLRQLQMGNQQTAASHQIGALHQEITGLKQQLHQWQTAQHFTYTRSAVDEFAHSHPRVDEPGFGNTVASELRLGFDLETAYKRAELLHPATPGAQTATPSAQTRPVDRSISGSPDVAPSNGASHKPGKQLGRREAIAYALKSAGMSH